MTRPLFVVIRTPDGAPDWVVRTDKIWKVVECEPGGGECDLYWEGNLDKPFRCCLPLDELAAVLNGEDGA